MLYTTLTYLDTEYALADLGIANARRTVRNQATDEFTFDLLTGADGADIFGYGAQIIVNIGRVASGGTYPAGNTTLPMQNATVFEDGTQWFVGYCVACNRIGSGAEERLAYKFVGPWEFFFERTEFQKLWFSWTENATYPAGANLADWRSQVVLGLSVNALTGPADTVPDSSATNLMSLRQQIIEICNYCQAMSAYEQSVNGLGWSAYGGSAQTAMMSYANNLGTSDVPLQFQFDLLTFNGTTGNYGLPQYIIDGEFSIPGAACLIPDFLTGYGAGGLDNGTLTSAQNLTVLRAPLDSVNDITCAEAMRKMLRWIGATGSPVVWFDYETSPPTLKVSTRDQLPSISLAVPQYSSGGTDIESLKILRRDDLTPAAVSLKYRYPTGDYIQVIHDIATTISGAEVEGVGTVGNLQTLAQLVAGGGVLAGGTQTTLQAYSRRPGVPCATLNIEGPTTTNQPVTSVALPTSPIISDGVVVGYQLAAPGSDAITGYAKGLWATLFPDLAAQTGLAFADATNNAPTVVDKLTGDAVDITAYTNWLTGGGVTGWMVVPGTGTAGVVKTVTIKATFTYTANDGDTSTTHPVVPFADVSSETKTTDLVLTNIPTGIYTTSAPGEVIPYGLAGFIYNIEKIPQYQGSFTLVEQDITDQCPMGNNLNLTGGLTEWATMNACVQEIEYDLDHGRTTLNFGPATHLSVQDFAARLRVNRGPRWYYLNGNNATNAVNNNSNPTNTAFKDGNSSSKVVQSQSFLTSLATQHGATPLAVPAGLHINGVQGQTGGTNPILPGAPGVLIHTGGASPLGTDVSWIGLLLGDLVNSEGDKQNVQIRARELGPFCYSTDGGTTWNSSGYATFLMSAIYNTPKGIAPSP